MAEIVLEENNAKVVLDPAIEQMFKAGAHFAFAKNRRHPSAKPLIFGVKNHVEIFDLEQTKEYFFDCPSYPTARAYAYAAIDAKAEGHVSVSELRQILNDLESWLQGKSLANIGETK